MRLRSRRLWIFVIIFIIITIIITIMPIMLQLTILWCRQAILQAPLSTPGFDSPPFLNKRASSLLSPYIILQFVDYHKKTTAMVHRS